MTKVTYLTVTVSTSDQKIIDSTPSTVDLGHAGATEEGEAGAQRVKRAGADVAVNDAEDPEQKRGRDGIPQWMRGGGGDGRRAVHKGAFLSAEAGKEHGMSVNSATQRHTRTAGPAVIRIPPSHLSFDRGGLLAVILDITLQCGRLTPGAPPSASIRIAAPKWRLGIERMQISFALRFDDILRFCALPAGKASPRLCLAAPGYPDPWFRADTSGGTIMPFYECVVIGRNEITQQQVDTIADAVVAQVEAEGAIVRKREYWGLRSLAYRIKKNRKGHYMLFGLDASRGVLTEMERQLRLNEDVLRFLTIRVDEIEEAPPRSWRANPMIATRFRGEARRALRQRPPRRYRRSRGVPRP